MANTEINHWVSGIFGVTSIKSLLLLRAYEEISDFRSVVQGSFQCFYCVPQSARSGTLEKHVKLSQR